MDSRYRRLQLGGVLLAFTFMVGCVMTRGTFVEELDGTTPYRLECTAEAEACAETIEQVLVNGGFDVRSARLGSHTLRGKKRLTANERMFLSGPSAAATGARVKQREGTLAFRLVDTDTTVGVRMEGLLTLAPDERDSSGDIPPDTTVATRGHPLMIRYGLRLHRTDPIELVDPTSGRLESERLQHE